jgi:hypothetical protein
MPKRFLAVTLLVLAAGSVGSTPLASGIAVTARAQASLPIEVSYFDFPGQLDTRAFATNDLSTMVGSYTTEAAEVGFIRTRESATRIDIDSVVYPGANIVRTRLLGINNAGQIVGCYHTSGVPGDCSFGFLLDAGVFTPINYPGASITVPTGINDAGDIVGWTGTPDKSFLLRAGVFTTIEYPFAVATYAYGIGDEPDPTVVGAYRLSAGGPLNGFVRKARSFTSIEYPGSTSTTADAVNAAGQIAGNFVVDGTPGVFVLSGGDFSTIEIPGGTVRALNNANEIVGEHDDWVWGWRGFEAEFSGSPALVHASPASGSPGQANLNVLVTGAMTHFKPGTTSVAFGAGLTVNAVTVHNPNQATANVTIAPAATLGARTITATTGTEVVTLADGFAVTSTASPTLNVWPPTAPPASPSLSVVVTGDFTHFVQGATAVNFGGGITVNNVTVQSATQATVNVTVQSTALKGQRTVRVTTGSEVVSLAGGFTVTDPPSLIGMTPNVLRRLQRNVPVQLTGSFTRFQQGATSVDFGDGITVNSVTVHSPTLLTADVTVSGTATLRILTIKVTSPYEIVERGSPGSGLGAVRITDPQANFYGCCHSEIALYRPSTGTWLVTGNITTPIGFMLDWGGPGDVPLQADTDGDAYTDPTVYRPSTGEWFVFEGSYSHWRGFRWGTSTDVPVPADYDGDGATDIAVYRPGTGQWFVLTSASNFTTSVTYGWGLPGDVPVPGDYDGDIEADIAVYRPSTGTWFVLNSSSGHTTWTLHQWGSDGDIPVAADYDGDSVSDVAVYRPGVGSWFILRSSSGFTSSTAFQWGVAGDIPVPADYDGDGTTDPAVYRPANNVWYMLRSRFGYDVQLTQFGEPGDIPLLRRQ